MALVQRITGAMFGAAVLSNPSTILAQSTPPAPSLQQQGLPSKEQVELPKPQRLTGSSPSVQIDSRQADGATPCPLSKYDLQVSIRQIVFDGIGGKALPPEFVQLLAPIAATLPAGEAKLAIVCDIRDRATAVLRQAGYVASVQIPPQRLEDGILHLNVISGHIVDVHVKGDVGPFRRTLAARISRLKTLDPLNENEATRILLYANEIPGLHVQLGLRPAGTEPGALIGDMTISYERAAIFANVQNLGSKQIGRWAGYARAELHGVTGQSDLLYIAAQTTSDFDEQKVLQGGYAVGLGGNGSTLAFGGTYAWSRPDLGALDLRAQSLIAETALQLPFVRVLHGGRSTALNLTGGFDLVEQSTKVYSTGTGGQPLNRDRLRTLFLRVGGAYRQLRVDGSSAFDLTGSAEVRKGIDSLGATKTGSISTSGYTPSRFQGRADATVVRGDLSAQLRLGRYFSVASTARGQWSDHPLLNYDEAAIGNLSIGRGYDPGANSGDRLAGVTGELRVHTFNNRRLKVDLFGFYDDVWLWNLDANAIENDRNLRSYGGGMRVYLPGRAVVELTYARPRDPALLLPGAHVATDRLLLSITTRFGIGGM